MRRGRALGQGAIGCSIAVLSCTACGKPTADGHHTWDGSRAPVGTGGAAAYASASGGRLGQTSEGTAGFGPPEQASDAAPIDPAPEAGADARARSSSTGDAGAAEASSETDATSEPSPIPFPPATTKAALPPQDGCTDTDEITILANPVDSASAVVADASHVTFAELGPAYCSTICQYDGGPVLRAPRCGGAVEVLLDGVHVVEDLVDGGDVVYVARNHVRGGPGLVRIDKTTKSLTEIDACPTAAHATATHLYFADDCSGSSGIWALAHDSTSPERLAAGSATEMVTTPTHLYYYDEDSPSLFEITLANRSARILYTLADQVLTGLASTTAGLFAAGATSEAGPVGDILGPGDLTHFPPGSPAPEVLLTGEVRGPLHADGDELYFYRDGHLVSLGGFRSAAPPILRVPHTADMYAGRLYWSSGGSLLTKRLVPERALTSIGSFPVPVREVSLTDAVSDPEEIATLPNGGFVVRGVCAACAEVAGGASNDHGFVAFDGDFQPVWSVLLPEGLRSTRDLWSDEDGNVYVTGAKDSRRALYKYRPGQTAPDWSVPAGPPLSIAPNGAWVTTGLNRILAYSAEGVLEWERPTGSASAEILSVARASSGATVVTGTFADTDPWRPPAAAPGLPPPPSYEHEYLIRLNATGGVDWQIELWHLPATVLVDEADRITLVGRSSDWFDAGRGPEMVAVPGRANVVVAQYGPDGKLRWVRTYEGFRGDAEVLQGGSIGISYGSYPPYDRETDLVSLAADGPRVVGPYALVLDDAGTLSGFLRLESSLKLRFSRRGTVLLWAPAPEDELEVREYALQLQ